jgi:YD repeat-containing protein
LTRETCNAYNRDVSYTYDADSNRATETDNVAVATKD